MKITELVPSAEQRIVSLEIEKNGVARLFRRKEDDSVESFTLAFRPYILTIDAGLMRGFDCNYEAIDLSGNHEFRSLLLFDSPKDYDAAKKHLKMLTGFASGSPNAPYLASNDLIQQALIQLQIRLFAGMNFNQVRRMQIDIETLCTPGYSFSNPCRENDAVCIIGMCDNTGWECVLSLKDYSEKDMLQKFVEVVQSRDPDIIEGHNFFRFDLPYIEQRCKRHKVKLSLGRDGSAPDKHNSRFNIAERTVNYTRYNIFGRHIVDTLHLALFYDAIHRNLDSFSLKNIAIHFGVTAQNRTWLHLENEDVSFDEEWSKNPDRCIDYCLDDARETRSIAEILAPASFYQTQIIPLSYQNCIIRGNATRIDSIFLAEYLTRKHSIPAPEQAITFQGALSKSFGDGVFHNVFHCDVRSLYPSILLAGNRDPARDDLGVFLYFLRTLRTFRLKMKDAVKTAADKAERDYADSMQATFKILINSFYGYLGFAQGFLNDFTLAELVTATGRQILSTMLDSLTANGANAVEMDTDGIYFQAPPNKTVTELAADLKKLLPEGIDVDFDEHFPSMFAYKAKNYALLHDNGEITISGAALKSRGLEPFQRNYIRTTIQAILTNDAELYRKNDMYTEQAIINHTFSFAQLSKSETLSDSPETYRKKIESGTTRRSAAYELAQHSEKEYRAGDQVTFYITGTKKNVAVADAAKLLSDADPMVRDENTAYYLAKLNELRAKFSKFTEHFGKSDDLFSETGLLPIK